MSERPPSYRSEKDEKAEKGRSEKDEKDRGEKDWDEKWRRDPVSTALWAAVLIWAGLVLLAANAGILDSLTDGALVPGWGIEDGRLSASNLILAGAGVIVLLGVIYRLIDPTYRRPIAGDMVLGVVLIAIGLGSIIGWSLLLPLILLALGFGLLLTRLLQR